jgi:hypothetical protein
VRVEWGVEADTKRGGGRRTNDRFPEAKSIIRRGMERWKDLMASKWGSRYSVLQYRAWKSSTAKRTGVLKSRSVHTLFVLLFFKKKHGQGLRFELLHHCVENDGRVDF